jgi:DNA-binding PadR family transcriptional regulator
MISRGPLYGYQLRAEFDRRTGSRWPLNVGQVYKSLERLERDGLAVKLDESDADGHVFYEATEAGRQQAAEWLRSADNTPAPARDDLAIKLAMAVTLPDVDVDALIAAQRSAALERLRNITRESELSRDGLGVTLVNDAVFFAAETELRWLDHVQERVRQARAVNIDPVLPFDTALPKRGRPRSEPAESEGS